ncbi:hypothetical protein DFH11DRAFT_1510924 [Phellopilus nigrolimitatus]|nr:hypothetical protein DFH11DRAFT_1510924 [Phellopilus nigrolimitatus]
MDVFNGADEASAFEALLVVLRNVEISKIYDWTLTIDEEVNLIWPSQWGAPKLMYFLNRYVAFGDPIMICLSLLTIYPGTSAFGFVTAELILMMRTWAIWERRTWVTVLLLILFLAAVTVDVFVLWRYLGGVSCTYFHVVNPVFSNGCFLAFKNRFVYVDFILIIVTESVMLVMLVAKALQHFKHSRSTLMVRMFNDGVIYFAYILLTSIANLVSILVAPVEMHNFLIITQRVFHSIFCTRVLLHIRGAYTNNLLLASTSVTDTQNSAPFGSANYAFRSPTGADKGAGASVGTYELRSRGDTRLSRQVLDAGADAGWGQGHGYDSPRSPRSPGSKSTRFNLAEGEGDESVYSPPSAVSNTFPFSEERETGRLGSQLE